MSEARLRAMLDADSRLRVSGAGLFYVDPPAGAAPAPTVAAPAFPLADTFKLHSKPGSNRTIYLDFDGHNVSGTWWNQAPFNLPATTYPAWTTDGDPSTFNDAERTTIQDVFQRVAEDYAPFDVDVTTQDPGEAALIRNGSGDSVYGTRALITPSSTAVGTLCGGGCGGIAFIDVFDASNLNGLGQPAFIFPQNLGPDVGKFIADAATHEVGHNLGLVHDGTTSEDYYSGHGSPPLWGPIMGGPYEYPVTQWALSDYPNAKLGGPGGDPDGLQPNPDDIATIAGNGTPFRSDEPGTSIANAGAVPSGTAYITNRTDVDYYSLGTCSGNLSVVGTNAPVSPNLDIELQLLNSGGNVVVTDNPLASGTSFDLASGLDATVSVPNAASGTYYVRVDGVGAGNPTTAYTDYGSVGAYNLQVTGCGGVVEPPDTQPPSAPQGLNGFQVAGTDTPVVELHWNPPGDDGGAAVTQYNVYVDGDLVGDVAPAADNGAQIGNVPTGSHDFGVSAVNSAGEGPQAHVTINVTDSTQTAKPGKPRIGTAKPGKRGGKLTATVSWQPPSGTTNPLIDGYQVLAYRENRNGKFVLASTSPTQGPGIGSISFSTNSKARVKFAVKAHNSLGWGPASAKSNAVRPR
jgi:hypothetical protein